MPDTAILLAAGSGRRMGGTVDDKVLAILGNKPVLTYSLDAFLQSGSISQVCIVYRDEQQRQRIEAIIAEMQKNMPANVDVIYVPGGKERQDSVLAALEAIPESDGLVFIHDGARPMISAACVSRLREAAQEHGAACAARSVTDTIKREQVTNGARSLDDLPRDELRAMETPQVFRHRDILRAYRKVRQESLKVTDDAAAAARVGIVPQLLDLGRPNPKITTAADLDLVEYLLLRKHPLEQRNPMRIGFGYDIHRLVPGRRLILGGVEIPHDKGLEGHSDADCLSHAIADAILGAAGLRDIGFYFPPGRPETAGIDSLKIIAKAVEEAAKLGLRVGNLDCTLIAREPKIAPHIDAMKDRLSGALKIPPTHIGIKATTNEDVGGLGRGEGIAAHAVCLLTTAQ